MTYIIQLATSGGGSEAHDINNIIRSRNNENNAISLWPRAFEMINTEFQVSPINGDNMENIIRFPRTGGICTPKQIMCYNCSEDFEITSISLLFGGNVIIEIPEVKALDNVVKFVENIRMPGDNNLYKTYHLDKTKLFFEINLLSLQWREVKIKINTYGSCDKIKLNNEYCYLHETPRRSLIERYEYDVLIKNLKTGTVRNYNSGQDINIYTTGNVNGFILSGINPNIINKIQLKLNGNNRISYDNKYEIITNTRRISNNSIYINLNSANFDDDITLSGGSMNTGNIDSLVINLGLDPGHEHSNFHILCYTNSILLYQQGIAVLKYTHSNISITIGNRNRRRQLSSYTHTPITRQWETKNEKIKENDECPVTFRILADTNCKYIKCIQCKKNFDIALKDYWVKEKNNCPMCRANWTNYVIYTNI